MLVLLVACCILIYGMVMIFLPKNYQSELENQATSEFYDLVAQVEQNGWEESSDHIFQFSMRNHASVKITDEWGMNCLASMWQAQKIYHRHPLLLPR